MSRFLRLLVTIILSPLILVTLTLGLLGIILAATILFVFGLPLALLVWLLAQMGVKSPT
jgi:hypothetical protein